MFELVLLPFKALGFLLLLPFRILGFVVFFPLKVPYPLGIGHSHRCCAAAIHAARIASTPVCGVVQVGFWLSTGPVGATADVLPSVGLSVPVAQTHDD